MVGDALSVCAGLFGLTAVFGDGRFIRNGIKGYCETFGEFVVTSYEMVGMGTVAATERLGVLAFNHDLAAMPSPATRLRFVADRCFPLFDEMAVAIRLPCLADDPCPARQRGRAMATPDGSSGAQHREIGFLRHGAVVLNRVRHSEGK